MVSRKICAFAALLVMLPGTLAARSGFDDALLPDNARKLAYAIDKDYAVARQATYVLAVGAHGHGWGSADAPGWSAQDRIRLALQKCEHYAQEPCILLIRDNDPTGETRPRARALDYPTRFSLKDVPFVSQSTRRQIEDGFASQAPHRALALHRNGIWGAVSGRQSRQDAMDAALARCQREADGDACFLYAVDDRVLFSPETNLRPQ